MSNWSIRWASIHPLDDALHHTVSIVTFALGMATKHHGEQCVEQAFIPWTTHYTRVPPEHWYTRVSPECRQPWHGGMYPFAYVLLINPLSKHSSFGRCATPYCLNWHICPGNGDQTSWGAIHSAIIHPMNDALHQSATRALMHQSVTRLPSTITWGHVPICTCPIDQSVEQAFILWTMRYTILLQLTQLCCDGHVTTILICGYLMNLMAPWPLPPATLCLCR